MLCHPSLVPEGHIVEGETTVFHCSLFSPKFQCYGEKYITNIEVGICFRLKIRYCLSLGKERCLGSLLLVIRFHIGLALA